jgi:hypothetical protein
VPSKIDSVLLRIEFDSHAASICIACIYCKPAVTIQEAARLTQRELVTEFNDTERSQ